jgi:hypothetical protein
MPLGRIFPNTPSGGKVEARATLLRANARDGRKRGLGPLKRFIPLRGRSALQGVLDALVTDGDAARTGGAGSGSATYGLTVQGHNKARHHPNPQFLSWPVEANT